MKTTMINIILIVVLVSSSSAFDGYHKGFVFGGGLGFAPVARCSNNDGETDNHSGIAYNLTVGYAYTERDMVTLLWERSMGDVPQTFAGVVYSRFVGPGSPRNVLSIGIGAKICSGPPEPHYREYLNFDTVDWPGIGFGVAAGVSREVSDNVFYYSRLSMGWLFDGFLGGGPANHVQIVFGIGILAY